MKIWPRHSVKRHNCFATETLMTIDLLSGYNGTHLCIYKNNVHHTPPIEIFLASQAKETLRMKLLQQNRPPNQVFLQNEIIT